MRHYTGLLLALLLTPALPSIAQEQTSDNVFRLNLRSPILFSAPPAAQPNAPLEATLSEIPAWVETGSPLALRVRTAGGNAPFSAPVAIGMSVPDFLPTPFQAGENEWAIDGTWLTSGLYSFGYRAGDSSGTDDTEIRFVEVSPRIDVAAQSLQRHANQPFDVVMVSGGHSIGRTIPTAGWPAWLQRDVSTGRVSGTSPGVVGTYQQTVEAGDGFHADSASFSLQVVPAAGLTYAGSTNVDTATPISLTPTVSNAIGTVSYDIASGTLPPGVTGPDPSTGIISGTPTTPNSYSATIRATDSTGHPATQALSFAIAQASAWGNPSNSIVKDMVFANGLFVGVGGTSTSETVQALWSEDGISWTSVNTQAGGIPTAVAYGNGVFVMVSSNGGTTASIRTSTTGKSWTRVSGTPQDLYGVAYGNGVFVAVGANGAYTSSDNGATWTLTRSGSLKDVAFGAGRFLASINYQNTDALYTSTNGTTWTMASVGASRQWETVTFAGDRFFAMASDMIATSVDGSSWSRNTSLPRTDYFLDVESANGLYIVSMSGTEYLKSTDLVTWTVENSRIQTNNNGRGDTITYGAGRWVLAGSNGSPRIRSSTNP